MMKNLVTGALGALVSLAGLTACNDVREFVLGTNPIEDKPVMLDSAPAPSKVLEGEPDPRLTIKLPNGGEASYEYAQGKRLMDRGQLTAASFVLTPKALAADGTEDELTLLGDVCTKRGDKECLASVDAHRKGLKTAGGASIEDLKKLAKKSPEAARALLMPRLEAGTISNEQAAVLADACHALKDKPCESMVDSIQK